MLGYLIFTVRVCHFLESHMGGGGWLEYEVGKHFINFYMNIEFLYSSDISVGRIKILIRNQTNLRISIMSQPSVKYRSLDFILNVSGIEFYWK